MRKLTLIGLICSWVVAAPRAEVLAQPRGTAFVIIVNPNNPSTTVDRRFVEEAFLKKATRWPDDRVIRPVDLESNSPIRRQFSEDVLQRPVEAVKGYWQQRIFSGRDVPPPELSTDSEVVKYVLQNDGAVGYVSADADLGDTKVLVLK